MSAPSTLILFAHPALEKSRANRSLLNATTGLDHVTVNDLYQEYPDFQIDVSREQALAVAHDRIVIQHPFYWYSTPAIVKEWFDVVLRYGWAYGQGGTALHGKQLCTVTTTGGGRDAYCMDGYNTYPVEEFLKPIEQTARLCGMSYAEPLIFYGALNRDESGCDEWAATYRHWLNTAST